MIRNYLKIAWRNLLRSKAFSIINITGLTIGMAAAALILLWIQHELTFDGFHEKQDRIYEAWNRDTMDSKLACWNTTPKVLARTLQQDFPEVESVSRVNWSTSYLLTVGEKKIMKRGNIVDSSFLGIFTFPLVKGDASKALMDPSSILITEKLAKELFNGEDAMGKTIKVDNRALAKVTGILKDLPTNSRFDFEYLLPWSVLRAFGGDDEFWGNNSTQTYALLKPNVSLAGMQPRLNNLKNKYSQDDKDGQFFLYPMKRWHLHSRFENGKESGGQIEVVNMFAIIAIFILLIACINFMNLSTARSEKRAKEVGIRKVVGAGRGLLIRQFIGESILLALIAGVLAIVVIKLFLPSFNQLVDRQLSLDLGSWRFWASGLAFIVLTGMLAGSYPAFFLSSLQPVSVLKGHFKRANAAVNPRKVLVVLQFTFAVILIISTIIVKQQISYAMSRENGYNKDMLVYHFTTGDLEKNYELVKQELISSGVATSVTKTSAPLTEGWSNTLGISWPGSSPDNTVIFDRYVQDGGLVKTAGMTLVQGRDIDLKAFPGDSSSLILNESAVKAMKLKDPIGAKVNDGGNELTVVGVIKDFILQSPYRPTVPMLLEGPKIQFFNVIHARLNPARTLSDNLKAMEGIYKKFNPDFPFENHFIDEEYAKKFDNEKRTSELAGLFAGLSILISCLGLFGLAAYMAENRIKEIGVRKVLGASTIQITQLLSTEFVKLVGISIVLASPVAWWMMNGWLRKYDYHIEVQWWVFVLAGVLALFIALATVSWQAVRAAWTNPVKSLRSE